MSLKGIDEANNNSAVKEESLQVHYPLRLLFCAIHVFLTELSYPFAICSQSWRSGRTLRAWFARLASCSIKQFHAGGSATRLCRLALTAITLSKARESGGLVCETVKLNGAKHPTCVYTYLLTLKAGKTKPWEPLLSLQRYKWDIKMAHNGFSGISEGVFKKCTNSPPSSRCIISYWHLKI